MENILFVIGSFGIPMLMILRYSRVSWKLIFIAIFVLSSVVGLFPK